jgi:hypothetical protein
VVVVEEEAAAGWSYHIIKPAIRKLAPPMKRLT